jgi:hypothetical protein
VRRLVAAFFPLWSAVGGDQQLETTDLKYTVKAGSNQLDIVLTSEISSLALQSRVIY